jgi:hypothetical protein
MAERLLSTVRPRSAKDARKFLHLDAWLNAIIGRALVLRVHNSNPLTILDLGTGTGLFPFVCRVCGHAASGLDLPGQLMRSPEREIFTKMPAAFDVTVERFPIHAFTPIEGIGTYDLITSFLINFNNHHKSDEWGRAQWEYFISDLRTHLNPGGRIALMMNANLERYGSDLQYYDEDTKAFLASVGKVYGAAIIISSPSAADSTADESRAEAFAWQRQRAIEAQIGGLLRSRL